MRIITRYGPHPGSNVGRAIARLSGYKTERSVRWEQALNSEENHKRAAVKLANAMNVVLTGTSRARERTGYEFDVVQLKFLVGDAVRYKSPHGPSPADHDRGHVLAMGFFWKDDDGDGPPSEPYIVYPIQMQGGRGLGGYWPELSMENDTGPQPPAWPID